MKRRREVGGGAQKKENLVKWKTERERESITEDNIIWKGKVTEIFLNGP